MSFACHSIPKMLHFKLRIGGSMLSQLKKGDYFLIASITIFSVLALVVFSLMPQAGSKELLVKVDGKVQFQYKLRPGLESDFYQIVPYKGHNKLEIQGDRVRMLESDCDDQICVHQGWISEPGETIICLPHRVSVSIVGEGEDDLDHVNY